MSLITTVGIPNPIPIYDRLHVKSIAIVANGEVDNAHFNLKVVMRRYARGELIPGKVDEWGGPVYKKHWMPTDQAGATLTLDIKNIESWIAAHPEDTTVAQAMGAVQLGIAKLLEDQIPSSVGSVTVEF
jgi:hypothetical protein